MSLLKRRPAPNTTIDEEAERVAQLQRDQPTNPVLAIRAYCLICMEGSYKRVEDCETEDCPIRHFRFGKNPFRKKRKLSEETRQKMSENLQKARAARKANK